jgi:hypothetical protein
MARSYWVDAPAHVIASYASLGNNWVVLRYAINITGGYVTQGGAATPEGNSAETLRIYTHPTSFIVNESSSILNINSHRTASNVLSLAWHTTPVNKAYVIALSTMIFAINYQSAEIAITFTD